MEEIKKEVELMQSFDSQDLHFYCCAYLSGTAKRKRRQAIMQELTGQKIPVAKCGIGNIIIEMEKYRKEQKNGN